MKTCNLSLLIRVTVALFLFFGYTASAYTQFEYVVTRGDSDEWMDDKFQKKLHDNIDRMVESGVNTIVIGSFYFMPSAFVDFTNTPYPEANQYSPKTIRRNIENVRNNIAYAHSKGIKHVLLYAYHHYLPYTFWKAHQQELNPDGMYNRLLSEAHQNAFYLESIERKDNKVGHQQWSNPFYKNFYSYATKKALEAIPEIDGFLSCYAESAWTYDEKKVRENNWTNWKQCIDYEATNRDFVDYVNTLYAILNEKRGNNFMLGIRDWYMEMPLLTQSKVPTDKIIVSIKYGGFDQPIENYPPWGDAMRKLGFNVAFDMQGFGSEHPSPLYWYDNELIQKEVNHIKNAGYRSIASQDFVIDPGNPIRALAQKSWGAAVTGKTFTDRDAENYLKPFYGDAAADILASLKYLTLAQQDNIRLAPGGFWKGDGLTVGGLLDRSIYMYMDSPENKDRLAFARQDVVGLPEYTEEFIKGEKQLEAALLRWKSEKRRTPQEAMDDMLQNADKCVNAMLEARKKRSGPAPLFDELVASAVIHKQLVLRDVAVTKAALAYFISGGQHCGVYMAGEKNRIIDLDYTQNNKYGGLGIDMPDTLVKTGYDQTDEVVKQYREFLKRNVLVRELCKRYMPRRRTLRHDINYNFIIKTVEICGKTIDTPVALDQKTMDECTQLIGKEAIK